MSLRLWSLPTRFKSSPSRIEPRIYNHFGHPNAHALLTLIVLKPQPTKCCQVLHILNLLQNLKLKAQSSIRCVQARCFIDFKRLSKELGFDIHAMFLEYPNKMAVLALQCLRERVS